MPPRRTHGRPWRRRRAEAQAPTDEADELRRAGRFDEAVQVSLRAVSLQVDLEPTLARAMERGDFHRGAREAELQAALAAFAGPSVSR